MMPADVVARVEEIRANRCFTEDAHGMEDQLYEDVLREIADGNPHAAELAREAIKTQEIRFARWYA